MGVDHQQLYSYDREGQCSLAPEQGWHVALVAANRVPSSHLLEVLQALGVEQLAKVHRLSTATPIGPLGGKCDHSKKPRVCNQVHKRRGK